MNGSIGSQPRRRALDALTCIERVDWASTAIPASILQLDSTTQLL